MPRRILPLFLLLGVCLLPENSAAQKKKAAADPGQPTSRDWIKAFRGGKTETIRTWLSKCPRRENLKKARKLILKMRRRLARRNSEIPGMLDTYPGREACLKTAKRAAANTEAELQRIAELENTGIALAKKKDYEGAIDKFSQALDALGGTGSAEMRSRVSKRIFQAAAKLKPPIPREAKRFAIRGQARFKKAKSKEGYAKAVDELKKAVRAAPWWPEAYFNLALVQEKAGQPGPAMRNLELYLLAKPGAKDAEAVDRKIIELELEAEGE